MDRRPRLNYYGRLLIAEQMEVGWAAAAVSEAARVSVATVYVWWRQFRVEGLDGLYDRSCRPRHSPRRVSAELESELIRLRRELKVGPISWPTTPAWRPRPATRCWLATAYRDWLGWTGQRAGLCGASR